MHVILHTKIFGSDLLVRNNVVNSIDTTATRGLIILCCFFSILDIVFFLGGLVIIVLPINIFKNME
jgi:hypothetical protein